MDLAPQLLADLLVLSYHADDPLEEIAGEVPIDHIHALRDKGLVRLRETMWYTSSTGRRLSFTYATVTEAGARALVSAF